MALLYRMGTGNGSGGDLKPYIVQFTCDSGYIGQTLTMTYKGTPHAGETVDNVSGTVASDGTLTLYPMHSGNWECSCYSSVTGTTMKKTIELSYWGTTNVEFNDTPDGATVTPTDDVQTWLHCANVWNKSYTTISEVVADTTTLNTLIANENANDYLVRSTTFATDICNNESAMIYIGLNDYCANKLLSDSTWCTAICDSPHFEKVLNISVPTLTGNSTKVTKSAELSSTYAAWKAFGNGLWLYGTDNGGWIGYDFDNPILVKKVGVNGYGEKSNRAKQVSFYGTNDKSNWGSPILTKTLSGADKFEKFNVNFKNYYKYFKCVVDIGDTSATNKGLSQLQFYGREA